MRRILTVVGGVMCLALAVPACRHTEIHERPVIQQAPPPQQPTTVIEHR
jgi:hypothetical protein